MVYCWKCGKELSEESKFCYFCGSLVPDDSEPPKPIPVKKVAEKPPERSPQPSPRPQVIHHYPPPSQQIIVQQPKRSIAGTIILIIIILVVLFFVVAIISSFSGSGVICIGGFSIPLAITLSWTAYLHYKLKKS